MPYPGAPVQFFTLWLPAIWVGPLGLSAIGDITERYIVYQHEIYLFWKDPNLTWVWKRNSAPDWFSLVSLHMVHRMSSSKLGYMQSLMKYAISSSKLGYTLEGTYSGFEEKMQGSCIFISCHSNRVGQWDARTTERSGNRRAGRGIASGMKSGRPAAPPVPQPGGPWHGLPRVEFRGTAGNRLIGRTGRQLGLWSSWTSRAPSGAPGGSQRHRRAPPCW